MCRTMSEQHRREAQAGSQQVQKLQAELEPLRRRANELQAAVDSHKEDNAIVSLIGMLTLVCCSYQQNS